jgi:hypothetical protein
MKIQVGKNYTFVVEGGSYGFYLISGRVLKVGKKYIHYQYGTEDWTKSKIEISKIVEVIPAGSKREKEWETYLETLRRWKTNMYKTKEEIEREETWNMRKRVEERLKEWIKQNPQPKPPLRNLRTALEKNKEVSLLRVF